MRMFWKIAGRVLLGLLITIYVAVAVVNYSVVQSYLGAAAGRWLSEQWGGELHIGSLHAMPWDHVILDDVRLVAPDGDTIFRGQTVRVRFNKFPYSEENGGGQLSLERVYIRNAYYHLETYLDHTTGAPGGTNLNYIFDYYRDRLKEPRKSKLTSFTVDVRSVLLRNVHYRMDLPEHGHPLPEQGVQIPHMEFFDINARFRNVHVVNDDVSVKVLKLSTRERSGFVVDNIAGDVHVGPQDLTVLGFEGVTPMSRIVADVRMTYPHWMKHYLHTVEHDIHLSEETTVAMSDVAYWAPVLWGIEVQLQAGGEVHGRIDSLLADDLWIGYGDASSVAVSGCVAGLPHPDSTVLDIEHAGVKLAEDDLLRLRTEWPQYNQTSLAQWLQRLGYLDLKASGRGRLDGTAAVNLYLASGIGKLRADVGVKATGRGRRVTVEANSDGIGLALLGSDWLTHSGLSLSAEALLPKRVHSVSDIQGEARIELINSVIQGNRLSPVEVQCHLANGLVSAEATAADPLLRFIAHGHANLAAVQRNYRAEVSVDHLDAAAFGLLPEKFADVGMRLVANATGNTADSLSGSVVAHDTRMGPLHLNEVRLDVDADGRQKTLRLNSDPVNASVYGKFDYADLPIMMRHTMASVLPAELGLAQPADSIALASIGGNTLNFNIRWNDDGRFLASLNNKLRLAKGTHLSGSYNNAELIKMAMRSDSLRIGALMLENIGLSSHPAGDSYVVELEAQEVGIGTRPFLERAELTLNSNPARAIAGLTWGQSGSHTQGDLMLSLRDGHVSVVRPGFTVSGVPWEMQADSLMLSVDGGLRVDGHGIALRSAEQAVTAHLRLTGQANDCVELAFERFSLEEIAGLLLQETPLTVSGDIDGRFSMYGLNETPYFNANLTVDSCVVNRQPLGDVQLRSNWNAELNMLSLDLAGDQIDATGWIELGKNDPEMNFNVDFDRFELGLAAPLLSTFASRFDGRLHGSFDVSGTVAQPSVVGEAFVEQGAMKIDLTGVTYYFNDTITFNNKRISLDGFQLRDSRDNIATIDGEIRYDHLEDIRLDLQLQTDNLLVLDRAQGRDFHGVLLASATGTVRGPVDNLSVYVNARSNAGSRLTVPVSDQRQVKAHNYITFVSDKDETVSAATAQRKEQSIDLEVDLSLTPDLQLNLPMDFSEVTVKVGASGQGDLHLSMAGTQEPQVMGSYEFTSGTMKLGMLSLIEKTFAIESGSSIGFQGNLPDARFDLKAVYSQRVNLSTLTGTLSDVGGSQKYLQVEDVIAIAGTLQEPTIGFDIRLPNADASVEEEVFAYIDRSSERDMLNQSLSLLLLGHFYNSNNTMPNGNIATSGSISALSSLLSDMVQVVDINVDYKAANEVTRDQLDVNISKDWGRWYLESTLGYGGESRELQAGYENGAVIDALVGYRINPLVHLFAYNRTNTNDYTRMDLPYKQGVGLKLTKDFDRWSELFRRKTGYGKKKTKK